MQGTASASKTDAPAPSTSDAVGLDSLLKELASEASKKSDGPLHVALIGVANVGFFLPPSLFTKSDKLFYFLLKDWKILPPKFIPPQINLTYLQTLFNPFGTVYD